jgi:hypothetical protein
LIVLSGGGSLFMILPAPALAGDFALTGSSHLFLYFLDAHHYPSFLFPFIGVVQETLKG